MQIADRRAIRLDIIRCSGGRARRRVTGVAHIDEGDVAEVAVGGERLDRLVPRGVPYEGELDALCEQGRRGLADEGEVGRGRDEIPVRAAVLHRKVTQDFREARHGNVVSLSVPAPRGVLAVEALHRAAREEHASGAVFADERRFLAEVGPPAEYARKGTGLTESNGAGRTVGAAAARTEFAGHGGLGGVGGRRRGFRFRFPVVAQILGAYLEEHKANERDRGDVARPDDAEREPEIRGEEGDEQQATRHGGQ